MSIEVPDFADAIGRLDEGLGLRITVSPQAPDRHGRVYVDRAYLEVTAHPGSRAWAVTSCFLRFSDPERLRDHLSGARLGYRYQAYEGIDGRWDDVELDVAGVPVPILVRRTEPARRREDYRRWEPGRAMELWQMDVMGRVHLAGGAEVKVVPRSDRDGLIEVLARHQLAAGADPEPVTAGACAQTAIPVNACGRRSEGR